MGQTVKMTVTLPGETYTATDMIAKRKNISRSSLVAHCLAEYARKDKEELMAEGYRELANQQCELAELALQTSHEVVPEW